MSTVWHYLTTVPLGQFILGVVGNLVASAILVVPGLLHINRRVRRNHEAIKQHVSDTAKGRTVVPDA